MSHEYSGREYEGLTLFITLAMYAIPVRRNLKMELKRRVVQLTQVRLSMRLNSYLRNYTEKNVRKDNLPKEE